MMGFRTAVRTALSKYFVLSGRAPRSEFWWFFLFYNLVLVLGIIVAAISFGEEIDENDVLWILLVYLALIPPLFTVTARRLHDKGLTAWVMLLVVVPFGQFAILILCALPGDEGPNAYGPDPIDRTPPEPDYAPSNIPRVEDDD